MIISYLVIPLHLHIQLVSGVIYKSTVKISMLLKGKVANVVWKSGHVGSAPRESLKKKAFLLSTCMNQACMYSHGALRVEFFPSPVYKCGK